MTTVQFTDVSLSNICVMNGDTVAPFDMQSLLGSQLWNFAVPSVGPISMDIFRGKSASILADLYAFGSHTFTNAGVTGNIGPTLTDIQSAYSTYSWTQNTANLSMSTRGIQVWTVPTTAEYKIYVAGASGENANGMLGGQGRKISSIFSLTKGQHLLILVGQKGGYFNAFTSAANATGYSGGGGGGTFVALSNASTPQALLVAGGGSGAASTTGQFADNVTGCNAEASLVAGTGLGGTVTLNNNNNQTAGSSGAGFSGNGILSTLSTTNGSAAISYLNGGAGGSNGWNEQLTIYSNVAGGFGGGAGTIMNNFYICIGGAGGGYTGGNGSPYVTNSTGRGGGNFTSGSNIVDEGYNTGHGYVIIKNLKELYAFTNFTFNNMSTTGRTGPTTNTYNSTTYTWVTNTSYFTLINGVQAWTVPEDGTYHITIAGAAGGAGTGKSAAGKGRILSGTVQATANTVYYILVGQMGEDKAHPAGSGGGGGTYIFTNASTPLMVAGGGGSGTWLAGLDGSTTTTATGDYGASNGAGGIANNNGQNGSAGTGGNGGNADPVIAGGGGGGGLPTIITSQGLGGLGGSGTQPGGVGGFGGGGGGGGYTNATYGSGGGAGGGYSGGSYPWNLGAGGGGSYAAPTLSNVNMNWGLNIGHGYVTIQKQTALSFNPYWYYKFDGNLTESIRGNNATSTGTAPTYPTGKKETCVYLGANTPSTTAVQYVSTSTANLYGSMSFCMWINVQGLPNTSNPSVILSMFPFKLYVGNVGGVYRFDLNILTNQWFGFSTNYQVVTNTWIHHALTYTETGSGGTCKIYVNGVLDTTFTTTGLTGLHSGWSIGSDGLPRAYKGMVDEFMVFNRVLTPEEVAALAVM